MSRQGKAICRRVEKKIFKAEAIQFSSTMSETRAALAERTLRSLKNMLYRYLEVYGNEYFHKLSQFVTTMSSSRKTAR